MAHKFKLKDRVEYAEKGQPNSLKGSVVALDGGSGKPVGVEFDAEF